MPAETNPYLPIQVWQNGGQWRIGYSGRGNYFYTNPDISAGPTGGTWTATARGEGHAPTFRIKGGGETEVISHLWRR